MKLAERVHRCRILEFLWRGHHLIIMENRYLRIGVIATKGADIVEFRYKPLDLDVLWHAPQGVLPPGTVIPPTARRNGYFLDHFEGGWQEVLPNAGNACVYKNADLGQHGEVALLPWEVEVIEDRPERIELQFSVATRRTPFRLLRSMALEEDATYAHFTEAVVNEGEEPMHYGWGHHPSFGPPFLEPGCEIDIAGATVFTPEVPVMAGNRYAPGQKSVWPTLLSIQGQPLRVDLVATKEQAHSTDSFYLGELTAGWFALRNPQLEVGFAMCWDKRVFPYLWCWQVYGGSMGYPYYGRTFNVAIEPFNCPIATLDVCAENGWCGYLEAGAGISTDFDAGIFLGKARITHLDPGWRFKRA